MHLSVECDCWERGLCRPCPVDRAYLLPFNVDRRAHGVKSGIPDEEAVRKTYLAWKETACEHRFGVAFAILLGSPDDIWEIRKMLLPLLREGSLLLESLRDASDSVYHFDPEDQCLVLHEEAIRLLETGLLHDQAGDLPPLTTRQLVAAVARASLTAVVHHKGLLWY